MASTSSAPTAMESEPQQETPQQAPASTSDGAQQQANPNVKKPTAILVIGMAGSGKTTLIQRLASHLCSENRPPYIINMDPAVLHVPYAANIDIRDTVKYKNVMKQYNLGPNGGILTSCNLFATRFDQVISLCEKPRDPPLTNIILDTPGQIEIFTWSASGQIVTELFASSFPTVVVYVVDTPRCASPQTFMSNMLQAVSILYKTKLPMLLVFNKVDVTRHEFALEWMSDFEVYQAALEKDTSYAATLSRSLSLVLDEFYRSMRSVGVSAVTGEGMTEFFQAVDACAAEYQQFYVPELEARRQERERLELRRQKKEMERLRKDMASASVTEQQQGGGSSQQRQQGQAGAAGPSGLPSSSAGAAAAGAAAAGPSSSSSSRGAAAASLGAQPRGAAGAGARGGIGASRAAGGVAGGQRLRRGGEEEEDEEEGEEADLELSDDSIEDDEAEEARWDSRAK